MPVVPAPPRREEGAETQQRAVVDPSNPPQVAGPKIDRVQFDHARVDPQWWEDKLRVHIARTFLSMGFEHNQVRRLRCKCFSPRQAYLA